MKFVHIADMHLDTSFNSLNEIDELPEKRRFEQRKALRNIIDYIKENDVKYFFISGDFYEHDYIRRSTIDYCNDLFKEIPDTKIFIAPGNHDPAVKNSFYNTYNWSENVYIFKDKIEKIENENVDIYGYGFTDFYCKNSEIENIKIENKNKINILAVHGSLDGGNDEYKEYNPMSSKKMNSLGFDYIALGHIHKPSYNDKEEQRIVYPGSTLALGFDELGKHGMIVGDITKYTLKTEFVILDTREYIEKELDISDMQDNDMIAEKIENLELNEDNLYKIILVGNRNFPIDTKNIKKLISKKSIIKVKDNTKIAYNLQELMQRNDLTGNFAKRAYERYKKRVN